MAFAFSIAFSSDGVDIFIWRNFLDSKTIVFHILAKEFREQAQKNVYNCTKLDNVGFHFDNVRSRLLDMSIVVSLTTRENSSKEIPPLLSVSACRMLSSIKD